MQRMLWPLATGLVVLAVWSAAVRLSGTAIFPSPVKVLLALRGLWRAGVLGTDLEVSLCRVLLGFGGGVLLGVPLGALVARSRRAAIAINPLLQLFRPISPIAWIPLSIIFFGISNLSCVFLTFLAAFFPVVMSTRESVRNVPAIYLRAAENFGLSRPAMFFRVLIPAALPGILAGLRIALGVSWLVLVAAEMIAVSSGLGYLIIDARNAGQRTDLVVAAMLLIGTVGLLMDLAMRRVETLRAVRWGFRAE